MVTAGNDDLFVRLCDALVFPALPTDPSYGQNADRVANRSALHDLLQARFFEAAADGTPCCGPGRSRALRCARWRISRP